jgi:hypothetical protein
MSENADESKDALLDRAARALTEGALGSGPPGSGPLDGTVGDVGAFVRA